MTGRRGIAPVTLLSHWPLPLMRCATSIRMFPLPPLVTLARHATAHNYLTIDALRDQPTLMLLPSESGKMTSSDVQEPVNRRCYT